MNHVKTIVTCSAQVGFTGGLFFFGAKGVEKACRKNWNASYARPKYMNPSLYFCGNIVIMPLLYGTLGGVTGSIIGITAPISIPIIYLYKEQIVKYIHKL